jgi:hypothetical protein
MPFYFLQFSHEEKCERATSTRIIVYGTDTEARITRQEGKWMANQEHLNILKQGEEAWNEWRREYPSIEPDLSRTNLRGANLSYANLRGADFSGADLTWANLSKADFSGASLNEAKLTLTALMEANLTAANLQKAELTLANLRGVILINADLRNSKLDRANLINADLRGADFTNAQIGNTAFDNVNLNEVKGLDTIYHFFPSSIGIDTIYRSGGNIPEVFLKGAGVDDTFITYIRSLVGKPIEYYSCFISYSSKDETFAKRVFADLQSNNVRCWFAPEDLKWGELILTGIDEAIRLHDKLLLILSKSSVASGWVEREVKTALAKERKEKRVVLFPVRLDKAIFESPFDWATEIRHERNIGDFTHWKNHDDYQNAFTRLLRDLKADA